MRVGLFSGGLDSVLLRAWCRSRDIAVRWLHFDTGFNKDADARRAREADDVEVRDVRQRYLREVVLRPKFGYGRGMNPCLDCRVFMLRLAAEATGTAADALLTGEVVGQRGFDQSRRALRLTAAEAAVSSRVRRPLTDELGLHGRSRRGQERLAVALGVEAPPIPSGGCCRLAEPSFARRLRDLVDHRCDEGLSATAVERLRLGRHFRLHWALKAVVARDGDECERLRDLRGDCWLAAPDGGAGATALLEGEPADADFVSVAGLVARYSGGARRETPLEVVFRRGNAERREAALPVEAEVVGRWRV